MKKNVRKVHFSVANYGYNKRIILDARRDDMYFIKPDDPWYRTQDCLDK